MDLIHTLQQVAGNSYLPLGCSVAVVRGIYGPDPSLTTERLDAACAGVPGQGLVLAVAKRSEYPEGANYLKSLGFREVLSFTSRYAGSEPNGLVLLAYGKTIQPLLLAPKESAK